MSQRVEVIAEAGVNHNGSLDLAKQLVDTAAAAGADVVKFQTFDADSLVSNSAPLAEYQRANMGMDQTQRQMLRGLQLQTSDFRALKKHCEDCGMEFMSSPFDTRSLDFLVAELGVSRLKIASGEITNAPLLLAFARSGCELILSTGMCSERDIDDALAVLSYGMLCGEAVPGNLQECRDICNSAEGREVLKGQVTLLHCTSNYPAPIGEINLSAMQTMRARWNLEVGYSDHSEGIVVPLAAAALGASIIEKHFTIDRSLPGPDHRASLEGDELIAMVAGIRAVSEALGDGEKRPQHSEQDTRRVARKSLIAATGISAGEIFTEQNLVCQRPGTGVSPVWYWDYLGRTAQRSYDSGEPIDG